MRGGKLEVRPQFVLRRSTLLHDRRRSSPAGHAAPGVPRERVFSSPLPVPGMPPAQRAHNADLSWGRNFLCRRERFPSSPRPAPGMLPAPQGHDLPVVGADFLRRRERFLSSPLPAPGHPPAQLGHGVCTAEGARSIEKKSANVMSGALSAHRAWAKRGAPRAARPLRARTPTVERRTSVVPSLVPKCRKPVYLCPEAHALVQKSPPVAARHVGGCGRAAQDPDLPEGEAPPREGREMRPVRREARRFVCMTV